MESETKTKTIYVSRIKGTNRIKLRDSDGNNPGNTNLTTLVNTGDTVEWKLDENSGLEAIIEIKKKWLSRQLLKVKPKESKGVWRGTVIDVSPGKGKYEKYNIAYKIKGNSSRRWSDPKLQMKN